MPRWSPFLVRLSCSRSRCSEVAGCAAWIACKVTPEPHNQSTYDLFIGEITAVWADSRAFSNGHWKVDSADPAWRSLHYIAGGQFYATGESMTIGGPEMP